MYEAVICTSDRVAVTTVRPEEKAVEPAQESTTGVERGEEQGRRRPTRLAVPPPRSQAGCQPRPGDDGPAGGAHQRGCRGRLLRWPLARCRRRRRGDCRCQRGPSRGQRGPRSRRQCGASEGRHPQRGGLRRRGWRVRERASGPRVPAVSLRRNHPPRAVGHAGRTVLCAAVRPARRPEVCSARQARPEAQRFGRRLRGRRLQFELSEDFAAVAGFDFSHAFAAACVELQQKGEKAYEALVSGEVI